MFKRIHPNRELFYFISISVVIMLGLYYVGQMLVIETEQRLETPVPNIQNQSAHSQTTSAVDTTGWKTYRNETFGYEFAVPSDWHIQTYDELGREIKIKDDNLVFLKGDNAATNPSWFGFETRDRFNQEVSNLTGLTIPDAAEVRSFCKVYKYRYIELYKCPKEGNFFFSGSGTMIKVYDQTPEETPNQFYDTIRIFQLKTN